MARCPRTVAALTAVPQVDIPGRGPTAFFSILDAHTKIPPHTGVTNTRLTVHLPLIVPPGCRFRVGGETREWRAGSAWVFDDTIEHEAWNDSDAITLIALPSGRTCRSTSSIWIANHCHIRRTTSVSLRALKRLSTSKIFAK